MYSYYTNGRLCSTQSYKAAEWRLIAECKIAGIEEIT